MNFTFFEHTEKPSVSSVVDVPILIALLTRIILIAIIHPVR
jgi:hypothetical protein